MDFRFGAMGSKVFIISWPNRCGHSPETFERQHLARGWFARLVLLLVILAIFTFGHVGSFTMTEGENRSTVNATRS